MCCVAHPAHVHAAGGHVGCSGARLVDAVVAVLVLLPVEQLLLFIAPEQLQPFV